MIGIATPLIGHQVYKKDKCIKMEWWRQGLVLPKKSPSAAELEKNFNTEFPLFHSADVDGTFFGKYNNLASTILRIPW